MSYTLIDLHLIRRDSDNVLFSKDSPDYQGYVDWYDANLPTMNVDDPYLYQAVEGSYKGKKVAFCKFKPGAEQARANRLSINKRTKRGKLIQELCHAVVDYMTGKHDMQNTPPNEINNGLATHGAILTLLQANRFETAKGLIDNVTPDNFISQEDIDAINELYSSFLPEIQKVS